MWFFIDQSVHNNAIGIIYIHLIITKPMSADAVNAKTSADKMLEDKRICLCAHGFYVTEYFCLKQLNDMSIIEISFNFLTVQKQTWKVRIISLHNL